MKVPFTHLTHFPPTDTPVPVAWPLLRVCSLPGRADTVPGEQGKLSTLGMAAEIEVEDIR